MTLRTLPVFCLSLLLQTGPTLADDTVRISGSDDEINYSLGYQIGGDLRRLGKEIDHDSFRQGLEDALDGSAARLPAEEMNATLQTLKKDLGNKELENRKLAQQQAKEKYRGEGREFLALNAQNEGVVVLPSGLQYKVLRKGTGKAPGPHDTVKVNYRGTLLDGSEFDSSYRRNQPAEFRVDGVIAGWTEALQLMREGGKWQIFVPADLAYRERGPLADRTLIFEIELLSVQPST